MYIEVANSGGMAIQKRRFAIVDTHVLAIATHEPVLHPRRNQKLPVELRHGARRLISPGLHRIESVSTRCGVFRKGRTTLVG